MGDTLITVIAIALAAVLMFVFPLMTMSDRTDDVAQLTVETATTDFVDTIRTTGKITPDSYSTFMQNITSTGNTYDVTIVDDTRHTGFKARSGQNEADRVCNIYDLEGNYWENVAEENSYDTSYRFVRRGGYYHSGSYDTDPASYRGNSNGAGISGRSFRFVLYVM